MVFSKKIVKRFVLVINGMACHAGEYAYAALSTLLQGLMYIGTATWSCSNQVSCVPVLLTWHSVLLGLKVKVHYVCTSWGEFQHTLSEH